MMGKSVNFQCYTVLRTRNVLTGKRTNMHKSVLSTSRFESNFPSQLTCLIKNKPNVVESACMFCCQMRQKTVWYRCHLWNEVRLLSSNASFLHVKINISFLKSHLQG